MPPITSDDLRRFAVARSLFPPTTLQRAIARMQFIQADPIRAPARAQDLILRHRVKDYRVADLDRNYVSLGIEEDTFVNYGFVTRELQTLMHPRPDVRVPAAGMQAWSAVERKKAERLLAFLESRILNRRQRREQRLYFAGTRPPSLSFFPSVKRRGVSVLSLSAPQGFSICAAREERSVVDAVAHGNCCYCHEIFDHER